MRFFFFFFLATAYVDNHVSKDRRSSSRPVSKPSNSLDELLPQPSQWDLSEKNLLVIANGKAVPSANIRRTHSGGGADDEVPTLTVSDLPPGTTNTLRVFLKVSALECIVSRYAFMSCPFLFIILFFQLSRRFHDGCIVSHACTESGISGGRRRCGGASTSSSNSSSNFGN